MLDGTAGQDLPVGFGFRPYRGDEDHGAMAAVRLGCVERDRVDVHSVVEGLPTAAEIAEASAKLEEPSKNQILVVLDGSVVGYSTIRWWQEREIRGYTCIAATSCPSIATRASAQPC